MGSRNRYRSGVKKTEEKKVSTHTPGRLANKRKSDARITARALQLKKERETREKARANRPTRGQGGLEIGATTKRV